MYGRCSISVYCLFNGSKPSEEGHSDQLTTYTSTCRIIYRVKREKIWKKPHFWKVKAAWGLGLWHPAKNNSLHKNYCKNFILVRDRRYFYDFWVEEHMKRKKKFSDTRTFSFVSYKCLTVAIRSEEGVVPWVSISNTLQENMPLGIIHVQNIWEFQNWNKQKGERNLPVSKDFHFLAVDLILYGATQNKMTLETL